MNRTEIKGYLKDIISLTGDVISNLKSKEVWLTESKRKIYELEEHLSEISPDSFDPEQLIETIVNELFTSELEDAYEAATELQYEINSYAGELSESRAEKIHEKYEDLEIVVEKLSQSNSEYDDIENAIEHLEEAIDLLKGMLK